MKDTLTDLHNDPDMGTPVVHIFQDSKGVIAIGEDYSSWYVQLTETACTMVLPENTCGMDKLYIMLICEKECRIKWIDDLLVGDLPRHVDKPGGKIYLEFVTFGDDIWYLIKKVQFQNIVQ